MPLRGPALLVCNHVSHVDGALVGACVQRFVRFLVYGPYFRALGVPPAAEADARDSGDRRQQARGRSRRSSARARELQAGHVVCIFAEGAISRTGNLLPFKRGFERIVDGPRRADHPGLSRSRLGQHLQLQARQVLLEVAGAAAVSGHGRVRRAAAVDDDGGRGAPGDAWSSAPRRCAHRRPADGPAARRVHARRAKRRWWSLRDGGQHRPDADLRPGARRRRCCSRGGSRGARAGEANVGLLLPASVGGALANIAVLAGRQACRSTSTSRSGREAMAAAIDAGGHHDDPHVARVPREGRHRADCPAWCSSKTCAKEIGGVGEAARRCSTARAAARRWLLRRRYGDARRTATRSRRSSSRAAAPACRRA